ncbi:hypothetical protein FLCU109888_11530 [Flavobacterium cucumis]|uniref:Uncharacterized protein n=1 Tax=Flavobacterium cucumis TaxID=416016 RepID=A0A1M7ZVI2_9FLAO|nr:hypothetical protein [Flavobacterium cucumis]SHO72882.1 hypothetical protein SAMN05443547_1226 [Flavobacterium cucumis]
MQENEVTLTMKVKSNDPFEFKAKKEALEKIAKLDSTTLKNLSELASSEKAIAKFNSNIGMIKTFMA